MRRSLFAPRPLVMLLSAFAALLGPALGQQDPLLCYVGGTMRPAMEKIVTMYQAKTGNEVQVDYADSGQQFIKVEQTRKGDVLVVHDPYLGVAIQKGLADRAYTVAGLTGVIVVPKGNPKGIAGLRDCTQPGIRLILTDADYSTLGHIVTVIGKKSGLTEKLEAACVTRTKSGGEAANAVALGTADAAIVWNAVAFLRQDKLDAVPIEEAFQPVAGVDTVTSATFGPMDMGAVRVTVIALTCSKQAAAARAFAEFTASPEASAVWKDLGFTPWTGVLAYDREAASKPLTGSLFIHCAAGMRLPIEELAKEFEKAKGVAIQSTYDGSNKLLGQIELTRLGDVYIPGDADYIEMARAKGFISEAQEICTFVPVILVKKGNPLGIKALSDLLKPGTKIGQGDPKAAAVGRIMPRMLERHGIDQAAWDKNVVLSTATVNELGSAVKLGTLDAAVVWDAIAASYAQDSDAVRIDDSKNIFPVVDAAVLSFTKNPDAARAFVSFLASDRGQVVLKRCGYSVHPPK